VSPQRVSILFFLSVLAVSTVACQPDSGTEPPDGGSPGDTGTGDAETCPSEWDCCEDEDCSDGIFCNGIEVCDRGECQTAPAPECDDGLSCTEDACDEARNLCVFDPNHALCSDSSQCNGDERCEPADTDADEAGCVEGSSKVCGDDDDCTEDFCDEVTDECATRTRDSDADGHGDERCGICDRVSFFTRSRVVGSCKATTHIHEQHRTA